MAEALVTRTVITPETREWLMQELRFPVMATIGSDGMPSLSVIWFDLDPDSDDIVLLNTKAGRLKELHLRRDNRLSLCFEQENDYVTLEGRAELVDDEERSLEEIKDLARRYGDDPEDFNGQHRVTILMRVERVIRHT
jgi:PPOX class probable F420-dependent enzyme